MLTKPIKFQFKVWIPPPYAPGFKYLLASPRNIGNNLKFHLGFYNPHQGFIYTLSVIRRIQPSLRLLTLPAVWGEGPMANRSMPARRK